MCGSGFCWISAAKYYLNVRSSETTPLYATFAEVYQANVLDANFLTLPCAGTQMAAALGLAAGEMVGYSSSATGYPSNMQPALALAVDSAYPGAASAWTQFMNRTVKPDYAVEPQFAIVPR